MASIGVSSSPRMDCVQLPTLALFNSSKKPRFGSLIERTGTRIGTKRPIVRCSLSRNVESGVQSQENDTASVSGLETAEDESSHVTKFNMSDFKIRDRVSIGLGGRLDEVVFEATVKDPQSSLYKKRVVLRRFTSTQAKRRGKRALEVLKKLAHRKLMYHSYSMQVHGYVCSATTADTASLTLVHGYHGSSSLRHWLQRSDWLPTLEATLALDEDSVRRVGDDSVGGPTISRQLRLIRILMRDLLIGVNYLHSHGLAHTALRLENLHISPMDRHIKVGILGNAADFYDSSPEDSPITITKMDRRKMMIAFDIRCVGFIMAKIVMRELMDPMIFSKFKSFLNMGNDPSCLREFLLHNVGRNFSSENVGLQILDRNWGAGWNLLSLLLAAKPEDRISCLNALRHPFLCGPKWRIDPSIDIIRWSLGSTVVRITEEYIYGLQQRSRLAHFIELLEMLNPRSKPKHWLELFPGKWRLLYSTGRHIGLTLRQPHVRAIIGDVHLTVSKSSEPNTTFSAVSEIGFRVMVNQDWSHDKSGVSGHLQGNSHIRLRAGRRLYLKEETDSTKFPLATPAVSQDDVLKKLSSKKWKRVIPVKEFPSSLPIARLTSSDVEVTMNMDEPLGRDVKTAQDVLREVRTQVPPEMFDLSKVVCGTYLDPRLLVLRCVNGSALLFTRLCINESHG